MKSDRRSAIDKITDKMDFALSELIDAYHDLEGLGCKPQERKLDTITGKLENLIYELCAKK